MVGRETPEGATEGGTEKTTGSLGSAKEGSLLQSPPERYAGQGWCCDPREWPKVFGQRRDRHRLNVGAAPLEPERSGSRSPLELAHGSNSEDKSIGFVEPGVPAITRKTDSGLS